MRRHDRSLTARSIREKPFGCGYLTTAFSCERHFQMTSRAEARDHKSAACQLQRDVSRSLYRP